MRTIQKVLIEAETGKKYFIKDINDDFHTSAGVISSKDLKSKKSEIKTNKDHTFFLIEPSFPDLWDNLQRGPQVMIHKDIGWIIAKTGINKNSIAVDAGGGSGSLCFSLANICKEVTVYETNGENVHILNKNKELFGFKNITIKNNNIYQGITEKEVDLITLDLPEPWQALAPAETSLRTGGFLVVYLPNLVQVKRFLDESHHFQIKIIETVELL